MYWPVSKPRLTEELQFPEENHSEMQDLWVFVRICDASRWGAPKYGGSPRSGQQAEILSGSAGAKDPVEQRPFGVLGPGLGGR